MDDELQGRGMVGVAMDDLGMIQMEHQDDLQIFEFDRADLDEVIDVLCNFRDMLKSGDLNIGDEENIQE